MIKWVVIAILVAGTFGIVWTAPWKDDVERLTDDVRDRVDAARETLGVLDDTTDGECAAVGSAASSTVREAVATISSEAERNPDAAAGGSGDVTLGEYAAGLADQIGACAAQVPRTGAGWSDLRMQLEQAAG